MKPLYALLASICLIAILFAPTSAFPSPSPLASSSSYDDAAAERFLSHSLGECKVCAEPPGAIECESGQVEVESLEKLLSTVGDDYKVPATPAPTASAGETKAPTGQIPEETTVKLSEIALLFCQNTNEEIPPSIGRLSRLRSMTMGTINVTLTIPTEIGLLQRLTSVVFESNTQLQRLPTEIGLLYNLDLLRIERSRLTGSIPTQLGKLQNLTALDLSFNDFDPSPFPEALASLTLLKQLDLSRAEIFGDLKSGLGMLTELEFLVLRDNFVNCSLDATFWKKFTKLSFLDISNNKLAGRLDQFSTLSQALLKVLDVEQNQVTGTIPTEFGAFRDITGLSLKRNLLTGTLPASLGNLVNLREFTASDNQIKGSIPESLGNLVNLNRLRLDNNLLTGTIPSSLSNLNQLTTVFLLGTGNDLDGPVPEELRNDPGRIESDLTMTALPSPAPVSTNSTQVPTAGQTVLQDVDSMTEGPLPLSVFIALIVLGFCVILSCSCACYFRPKSTTTEERVPIKHSPQPSMSHSPAQIQLT